MLSFSFWKGIKKAFLTTWSFAIIAVDLKSGQIPLIPHRPSTSSQDPSSQFSFSASDNRKKEQKSTRHTIPRQNALLNAAKNLPKQTSRLSCQKNSARKSLRSPYTEDDGRRVKTFLTTQSFLYYFGQFLPGAVFRRPGIGIICHKAS